MHASGFDPLVSFLFELVPAPVIIPVVVAVTIIIPLLEFLIPVLAIVVVVVIGIRAIAVGFPLVLVGAETLDIGRIGEFQLPVGQLGKLALDRVVMDGFLMPIV